MVGEPIISGRADVWLEAQCQATDLGPSVAFRLRSDRPWLLHWGLAQSAAGAWHVPPESAWPPGTRAFGGSAVQTPFAGPNEAQELQLRLPPDADAGFLVFDLYCPETKRWENNRGKDHRVHLPPRAGAARDEPAAPPVAEILAAQLQDAAAIHREVLELDGGGGELALAVLRRADRLQVLLLATAAGPLRLHWGLADRARGPWRLPPEATRPPGTIVADALAAETPFGECPPVRCCTLDFPEADAPPGLGFVLHQPGSGRWLKHRGQDFFIALNPAAAAAAAAATPGALPPLAERIVRAEVGDHGWTLMHRFNLCHESIGEVRGQRAGWVTLFVWLRFSAMRQLAWQRNYNTKPRELSHAQDRLTLRLAQAHIEEAPQRDLIRLALACLGRGGEGQRIRDEILQIMHRHHIKEVGGTWMEQWHQKLHNNTTPDDVVICEAYLEFLRGNGDLRRYDAKLTEGGVTRQRLAGFDRPINRNPEWHPHLKDGLIHDFQQYLALLRSVHSGTDLDTAAHAGAGLLDGDAREALHWVQHHFRNEATPALALARHVTLARQCLGRLLDQERQSGRARDALYLDLALEDVLRVGVERAIHSGFSGEQLVDLVGVVLENLALGESDPELAQSQREWRRLPIQDRFSFAWALHAQAALDRLRRAIAAAIDRAYQEWQPQAEQLGRAFGAEPWTVELFSEAVVRGRPAFIVSLLIRHLDPILRRSARLGAWQVVSPSEAVGEVRAVGSLRAAQGERFERPTILVADEVFGDEEPPEGVRAVITPSPVDLVSHVAVRARNARLLFATCYDRGQFDRLKAARGRVLRLQVTSAGDVVFAEAAAPSARPTPPAAAAAASVLPARPTPSLETLRRAQFERGRVGGKSWNLRLLAERLPGWIGVPRSVALPFGVLDAVCALDANRAVAERAQALAGRIEESPAEILAELRRCLLELRLPESLLAGLGQAMETEGLPAIGDASAAARRILQVWASKWNERAYFSRRTRGFPHEAMSMAVLIQEVVPAEYAFVIHTVNPLTGNRGELYAEVVLGLGETLVGNYPGRALSFVSPKAEPKPSLLAFPSKSLGLYGGGLIFRSDSNAEDLEGYAGAGLYDSMLLEPARETLLDYTRDPLVWDPAFGPEFLATIARIGALVEQAYGTPQDIEGAYAQGRFHLVQTRPQVGLS